MALIVGIDFGKKSIKAAELDVKKDKLTLENYGFIRAPSINLESQEEKDIEVISDTLKELFSESKFETSQVVVGIEEKYVFTRVINIPAMSEKELKNSIKYEAEQYIPLPLDKVNLSYQIIDPDFRDKNKMKIQLIAAKKDVLNNYVKILKKADLVPKAIEPETMALARLLGDTKENPVGSLIVDVGYAESVILVCYGGFVRFTRTVPVGGNIINKAIQQELNLDQEQANEYKKAYGLDSYQGEGKVYNAIKPIADNLITEIKRAHLFFTNHNPFANIKLVILSGGTALMPNFLTYIAKKMDLETQVATPYENIKISGKLSQEKELIKKEGPKYCTALGLAMRKL